MRREALHFRRGDVADRRVGFARQRPGDLRHTPGMRQWACVFALLLGLAGNGYVAAARIRLPIPIERRLEPEEYDGRLFRTLDWWRA